MDERTRLCLLGVDIVEPYVLTTSKICIVYNSLIYNTVSSLTESRGGLLRGTLRHRLTPNNKLWSHQDCALATSIIALKSPGVRELLCSGSLTEETWADKLSWAAPLPLPSLRVYKPDHGPPRESHIG
jgi:hypothetical protein